MIKDRSVNVKHLYGLKQTERNWVRVRTTRSWGRAQAPLRCGRRWSSGRDWSATPSASRRSFTRASKAKPSTAVPSPNGSVPHLILISTSFFFFILIIYLAVKMTIVCQNSTQFWFLKLKISKWNNFCWNFLVFGSKFQKIVNFLSKFDKKDSTTNPKSTCGKICTSSCHNFKKNGFFHVKWIKFKNKIQKQIDEIQQIQIVTINRSSGARACRRKCCAWSNTVAGTCAPPRGSSSCRWRGKDWRWPTATTSTANSSTNSTTTVWPPTDAAPSTRSAPASVRDLTPTRAAPPSPSVAPGACSSTDANTPAAKTCANSDSTTNPK